jgi:hypothetical protein
MEVRLFALLRDLFGIAGFVAAYASGGDNTSEVQSLSFQGENPRSNINWLCLAIALLKALFFRATTIFVIKIYDL